MPRNKHIVINADTESAYRELEQLALVRQKRGLRATPNALINEAIRDFVQRHRQELARAKAAARKKRRPPAGRQAQAGSKPKPTSRKKKKSARRKQK